MNLLLFYLINKGPQLKLMNIPAQLIIGSFIYNKLLEKEKKNLDFIKDILISIFQNGLEIIIFMIKMIY